MNTKDHFRPQSLFTSTQSTQVPFDAQQHFHWCHLYIQDKDEWVGMAAGGKVYSLMPW